MKPELTVGDIEFQISKRMEDLEKWDHYTRLDELRMLLDWILCGDEY